MYELIMWELSEESEFLHGFTENVSIEVTVEIWIRVYQMGKENLSHENRWELQVIMKSAFHNQQELMSSLVDVKISSKQESWMSHFP